MDEPKQKAREFYDDIHTLAVFFYNGFRFFSARRSVNSRLMIINGYGTEESVRGSEKEWRAAIKRAPPLLLCNRPSTHTPFTALSFAKVAGLRYICTGLQSGERESASSPRRTKILHFLEWERMTRRVHSLTYQLASWLLRTKTRWVARSTPPDAKLQQNICKLRGMQCRGTFCIKSRNNNRTRGLSFFFNSTAQALNLVFISSKRNHILYTLA